MLYTLTTKKKMNYDNITTKTQNSKDTMSQYTTSFHNARNGNFTTHNISSKIMLQDFSLYNIIKSKEFNPL